MVRGCNCAAVNGEGSQLQELVWRMTGMKGPASLGCLTRCSKLQVQNGAASGLAVPDGPIQHPGHAGAIGGS